MSSIRPCIALLAASLMFGGLFAQSDPADTLPPTPLAPRISVEPTEIIYKGINIAWAGSFIPTVVFFNPGDDRLDDSYRPVLSQIAERLVQNPDVTCEVRGYYSPVVDDIDSPSVGQNLARRRAMAVRDGLLINQPQLGFRITVAEDGFELTEPFAYEPGNFDPRAKIEPSIPGWRPRVIVSTDRKPYWRRGFRNIAEEWGEFLAEKMSRNPDLCLLFSSGELGVPPDIAAERLETVVAKFEKEMDWKDESRLVSVHKGTAKPGEMIIDLKLSFFAPEPAERRLLWLDPVGYSAPVVRIKPTSDSLAEIHAYRLDHASFGSPVPIGWGPGNPPGLVKIKPLTNKPFLLPGENRFSLVLWRATRESERSEWLSVDIGFDSVYYEMAVIPVIPFIMNTTEPSGFWETALPPITERLIWLADKDGRLDIDVIGHSLDSETDRDSLALNRAVYLWDRLGERLMAHYGIDELTDLGKKLEKLGVSLEIREEVHSVDTGSPSVAPWATKPLLSIPRDHLNAWAPFATVKWEFRYDE
ncbi:hypothetical protein DRQ36_11305 [bacterium]|nr:MAG: hypothetical protein DRQ36_11305 [bacterium]